MKKKKLLQTIAYVAVIFLCLLATAKMIFVGYSHDEEYQIVMAYRNVMGDTLFGTMWEPHQTSAFINSFLIWVFMKITGGTTGVIVFLRLMGSLVQGGIAIFLYRTLRRFPLFLQHKTEAVLIAFAYYLSTVSLFAEAEYSNLLYWGSTLLLLFLCRAFLQDKKRGTKICHLVLGALSLCLMVLAFPPMILFAPVVFLFLLFLGRKKEKIKNALIFTGTALCFGAVYALAQIVRVGFQTFITTIPRVIFSDNTHQVSAASYWLEKLPSAWNSTGEYLLWTAAILAISILLWVLFWRKKKAGPELSMGVAGLLSVAATLFFWLGKGVGFEAGQIFVPVSFVAVLVLAIARCKGVERILCLFAATMAFCNLLIGYLFSNMELAVKLPHMAYIVILLLILLAKQTSGAAYRRFFVGSMVVWLGFLLFAKGFMLRSGDGKNNILSIENICHSGPGIGILSDYMQGYMMDRTYEEWSSHVKEGDTVLIVSETLHSDMITAYLFERVNVAHYAVNNPYTYTENLLEYWELYPEKQPNVIVIDCWFGEPFIGADEWIMQYIEEAFGYTEVADGDYFRYYRK